MGKCRCIESLDNYIHIGNKKNVGLLKVWKSLLV